ncbi:hypothetical protein [Escherichia coli]|uniref:hypothetical protein n=1 Tax=Escherichia coli TaxID=562 RepID=UPI00135E599A|nr:hypothetical protein [Escherichia coli]MXF04511.1 hypothetical protein [Escherichia coli]
MMIDAEDFCEWLWRVDPFHASRMQGWIDGYRRACKYAARTPSTPDSATFVVDGHYRVKIDGQKFGLFHATGHDNSVISWSSTEMEIVLEMATRNVHATGIYTSEGFIEEYQRLLVLYRAGLQQATAGE